MATGKVEFSDWTGPPQSCNVSMTVQQVKTCCQEFVVLKPRESLRLLVPFPRLIKTRLSWMGCQEPGVMSWLTPNKQRMKIFYRLKVICRKLCLVTFLVKFSIKLYKTFISFLRWIYSLYNIKELFGFYYSSWQEDLRRIVTIMALLCFIAKATALQ